MVLQTVRCYVYAPYLPSHEKIQVPKSGKIYSFNEGNYALWEDGLKQYIDSLKKGGAEVGARAHESFYA